MDVSSLALFVSRFDYGFWTCVYVLLFMYSRAYECVPVYLSVSLSSYLCASFLSLSLSYTHTGHLSVCRSLCLSYLAYRVGLMEPMKLPSEFVLRGVCGWDF